MTPLSKLFAAALVATGFAAQAPAQAGLPPLTASPVEAADASGSIWLAMGRGAGIRCALPPAAFVASLTEGVAADEADPLPAFSANPTSPRTLRANCPILLSAQL